MKNSGCLLRLGVVIWRLSRMNRWVRDPSSSRVLSQGCRIWFHSDQYVQKIQSEWQAYTKQFEIKQLRNGLSVVCANMFGPHNVSIIVLAPLI